MPPGGNFRDNTISEQLSAYLSPAFYLSFCSFLYFFFLNDGFLLQTARVHGVSECDNCGLRVLLSPPAVEYRICTRTTLFQNMIYSGFLLSRIFKSNFINLEQPSLGGKGEKSTGSFFVSTYLSLMPLVTSRLYNVFLLSNCHEYNNSCSEVVLD